MDPLLGQSIVIEIVLVLLCAFFAMAGASVEEASESRLIKEVEEGDRKASRKADRMLKIVEEPEAFLLSMHAAQLLAGLFAARFAISSFSPLLDGFMDQLWADVIVLLCVAFVLLWLTVYVPRSYAARRPQKAAAFFGPARMVFLLLRPVNALFRLLTNLVLRMVGVRPTDTVEEVSEDEIMLMVEEGEETGAIEAAEKELIENVFEFNNMTAEDIMIHRTDMEVVWQEDTHEEILTTIRESGLSRFPVCGEDIDDIVGVLSTREYLLNAQLEEPKPLAELLRKAYFVPESVRADLLFREMQTEKVHMAIVVDEYGGTSGLLTMEDLLEQLVGDIYDEFDEVEEQEISKLSDDTWRISGSAALETVFEALDLPFDEEDEDCDTLGGLVFSKLSVIPQDGTQPEVEVPGMRIQVEEIVDHRVEWAKVTRLELPEEEEAEEE
jgi:putative hemolysin